MKLNQAILEKLIDLPAGGQEELRSLFDDLGLEVKNFESEGGRNVYTIETLANRGDHACALGMAREISARQLQALRYPAMAQDLSEKSPSVGLKINTDKCLRYALMEMSLPPAMQLRPDLAAALDVTDNERHAFVHILNYVLAEIGQPMHAFDRDKIDGEITVDLTQVEEEIEALDGKTYKLPVGSLVIRDRKKIVAVAGVIGCSNSMLTAGSTRTLVESANFDPVTVRKTAKAMGLATDASFVFERGADPEMVLAGLKRAVYLAEGGGAVVREAESAHVLGLAVVDNFTPEKRRIKLSLSCVRHNLNAPRLDEVEVSSRLKYLGFQLEALPQAKKDSEREWNVTVPSWRIWDVHNQADLVEEYARVHGLNRIRLSLPELSYEQAEPNEQEQIRSRIEPVLTGQGLHEVITRGMYGSEDAALLSELDPSLGARHITVINALERANSHMKITNLLHFCRLAEQNHRRGVASFKVYELARLFSAEKNPDGPYGHEKDMLSLAASGRWYEHEYQAADTREELLSRFKGLVESLFRAFGLELYVGEGDSPFLHPGCQAKLKSGRFDLGFMGAVHPRIQKALDMGQTLLYAEIDVTRLLALKEERRYAGRIDLPSIRRDITLKVPVRTLASQITRIITQQKIEILEGVSLSNFFRKDGEDFSRITYRLTFRSGERTLEHQEVDAAMAAVLAVLKEKGGYELV